MSTSHPLQLIYDVRRRVQAARSRYWAESVDCDVSDQTHRDLAVVAMQYHDALVEFRDDLPLAEDDWPDISPIQDAMGETVTREVESNVFMQSSKVEQVPAVQTIPTDDIVHITEELDDIAKQLGFAADNEQPDRGRDDV